MLTSKWRWTIIVVAMMLLAWNLYNRSYQLVYLLVALELKPAARSERATTSDQILMSFWV